MMKQAVFDTNIVIDFINGITEAEQCIASYTNGIGILSIISAIEVRVGTRGTPEEQANLRATVNLFQVSKITEDISERTIFIRQNYKKLKLPDAIIWATAQSLQLPLITRNTKDFKADWEGIHIPYSV